MLSHDDEWIKSLVGWIAKRQIASYHYCEWVRGRGPGVVWTRPGSENRFLVTVIRCNSSGGAMPLQSHYRGHAEYYFYIRSVPQFSSSLIHVSSNPEPIFYIPQYAELQKLRRSQCRARWLHKAMTQVIFSILLLLRSLKAHTIYIYLCIRSKIF